MCLMAAKSDSVKQVSIELLALGARNNHVKIKKRTSNFTDTAESAVCTFFARSA